VAEHNWRIHLAGDAG